MSALAPDGRQLVGKYVKLSRSILADSGPLFEALDDDRVYAGNFMGGPAARPNTAENMGAVIGASLSTPGRTPYTVRLTGAGDLGPAGTIVGTTSLGNQSLNDERIHLGWTGYSSRVWGTQVNPECKLLLLEHLFGDCGFGRVQIQTDLVNERSQAAIERLGAVREGVLRRHIQRADGTFRDTVVYSILQDEWPAVKADLLDRLV